MIMKSFKTLSSLKFPPLVVVLPHTPTSQISKLEQRPLVNLSFAWMYSGNEPRQRKPVGASTSATLVLLVRAQKENPGGMTRNCRDSWETIFAFVMECETPACTSAEPFAVNGPASFSTSALRVPVTDTVVVFWSTWEVDLFNSKTQALEFTPLNLGQNSVVSGTAHRNPAFVGPARSGQL